MVTKRVMLALSITIIMPWMELLQDKGNNFADQKFEALAQKFLAEYLELNPEAATQLGEHKYDDRLGDYSIAGIKRQRAFNQEHLNAVNAINVKNLSKENTVDHSIITTQLNVELLPIDTCRS